MAPTQHMCVCMSERTPMWLASQESGLCSMHSHTGRSRLPAEALRLRAVQAQQVALPTEEEGEEAAAEARVVTYDYLLSMPIASLTAEKARGVFAHVWKSGHMKSRILAPQPHEAALAATARGGNQPGGAAARRSATGMRGASNRANSSFSQRPTARPAARLSSEVAIELERARARRQRCAWTACSGRRELRSSARCRPRSAVRLACLPWLEMR